MSEKVGIITFHRALNYGAVLQAYALQTTLERLGCDVVILDYNNPYVSSVLRHPCLRDYHNPLNYLKDTEKYRTNGMKERKIARFSEKYLHGTQPLDSDALKLYADKLDIIITGSDQVWNDKITHNDDTFYLDFATCSKRVSYAASIGSDKIPMESVSRIYPILKDYKAISVRETQAQFALANQLGLDVQHVLDPSLLLCECDYMGLTLNADSKRYVFIYMLFYSESLIKKAKKVAAEIGCKVYCVNASSIPVHGVVDCSSAGIEEWMGLIKNAEYVFTNSFHGVVFSVNFKKQFTAELPPAHLQASSRITDLLAILGLSNRIVTSKDFEKTPINYSEVSNKLNEERERSMKFLKQAIFGEPCLKSKRVDRSILKFNLKMCSGCGYCATVCPVNAITMEQNANGFMYPVVKTLKCINCGKCGSQCPTISEKRDITHPRIYAAVNQNQNALMNSSSGGVFYALAERILCKNGAVYGAAFNEYFELEHKRITDISQLKPLMGSKYAQSNAFKVFPMVLKDISEGIPVLFVGTPCQVAALRKLVGDKCDHLFLVDFVCHGTPSPILIRDHIKYVESYFHSEVISYIPRSKQTRYGHDELFTFANGKKDWKHPVTQAYKHIFYSSSSSIRSSCSQCAFANFARPGDLTIADFWGIERSHPELLSANGVSMIIENTDRGGALLSDSHTLALTEVSQADIPEDKQPHLFRPIHIDSSKAELFWREYHRFGWKFIAEKYAQCDRKNLLKWYIKQTRIYRFLRGR